MSSRLIASDTDEGRTAAVAERVDLVRGYATTAVPRPGAAWILRRSLLGAALGAVYWWAIRPRLRTWGATHEEVSRRLPGDDFVAAPATETTLAVTVDAPPRAVWRWLVRIGRTRGRIYSTERFDAAELHGVARIVPDPGTLADDERALLAPTDHRPDTPAGWPVAVVVDRDRTLVFASPTDPPSSVRSFHLEERPDGRTRLLARTRDHRGSRVRRLLDGAFGDPVRFVMRRRTLLWLKSLAERPTGAAAPRRRAER